MPTNSSSDVFLYRFCCLDSPAEPCLLFQPFPCYFSDILKEVLLSFSVSTQLPVCITQVLT